jgi:hypothetical protein
MYWGLPTSVVDPKQFISYPDLAFPERSGLYHNKYMVYFLCSMITGTGSGSTVFFAFKLTW